MEQLAPWKSSRTSRAKPNLNDAPGGRETRGRDLRVGYLYLASPLDLRQAAAQRARDPVKRRNLPTTCDTLRSGRLPRLRDWIILAASRSPPPSSRQ